MWTWFGTEDFLGLLMKPGPDPELVSGCTGLIHMGDWCGSAYAYTDTE